MADSGSTDRTAAVAAAEGARVCAFTWEDDFSAGRHFAIARAETDWILWLNADEELLPGSKPALARCMAEPAAFGYFVRIQNSTSADASGGFAETADLRLFRRRPDLRFVGRLHPALTPEFIEAVRRDGQQVAASDVSLRHYPSPTPPDERKLRWLVRLLELELRDRPGQLHYLIEYGRTLLRTGDPKGHAILDEAAGQVLAAKDSPAAPSFKVQVLLEYLLTAPPGRPISRDEAAGLAMRWFPRSPALIYRVAEQSFAAGDAAGTAQLLERLLEMGRTGMYDHSHAFDPGLVGDDAVINLAVCYRRLGRLTEAEQCYRRLLGSRHFSQQAMQGLATVQKLRRES